MKISASARSAGARCAGPAQRRQRGVALVAVMIAIAIAIVISNEFGTSTNVDMIAAANYRDQMRAHFLARSAINLAELVDPRPAAASTTSSSCAGRDPDHRLRRSGPARVLRQRRGGPGRDRLLVERRSRASAPTSARAASSARSRPRTTRSTSTAPTATTRRADAQERARRADLLPGLRPGVRGRRRRGLSPRPRDPGRRDPRLHRRRQHAHRATAARPRTTATRASRTATTRRTTTSTRPASSSWCAASTIGSGRCSARRSPSTAVARSTSARCRTPS